MMTLLNGLRVIVGHIIVFSLYLLCCGCLVLLDTAGESNLGRVSWSDCLYV